MSQQHMVQELPKGITLLVLDRPEAAQMLRISLRKLDRLIARGELKPCRIDGRTLVAWAELCRFVEAKTSKLDHVAQLVTA